MFRTIPALCLSLILAGLVYSCNPSKNATATREMPALTIQPDSEQEPPYRPSFTKYFDLIHTTLDVRFDYEHSYMPATASITMHPHFYPTNELVLNARGMLLNRVALINGKDTADFKYRYENDSLFIPLGRTYTVSDTLHVYIDYVARPEELKDKKAGNAVRDDKGLYFINPLGKIVNKPRQIWTQGEPQAASAWFPTIDAPNQKMTQEIKITADNSDVTLSNGTLISSIDNKNGTHTDTWRQTLPHSPYLAMMAVGPFSIIKDNWRGKEVNYYVEPEYKNVAKRIFGNTPEMIELFSTQLGVDYPWEKYNQVVVRDFVSGAMENTSATVHMEGLQRNERQLLDETNEDFISHELFHQWFGDLVTFESWANTPLNESFATYGEYIWTDYKYGRDAADNARLQDLNVYLREAKTKQVNLIRYHFNEPDDMFDRHSYQKGGCILHLLRTEVGDSAFFQSLKVYLQRHQYKNVEVHDLRLAFEEVTGQDLNWFFDQWFLDRGHPVLDISYSYDEATKTSSVTIRQDQDSAGIRLFRLPLAIDIYSSAGVIRKSVVLEEKQQTFRFAVEAKPLLINVDATKSLVGQKNDHHTAAEWAYQYYHAPLVIDRLEAIKSVGNDYTANSPEEKMIWDAMKDRFWNVRVAAIKKLNDSNKERSKELQDALLSIAQKDPKSKVRETAINQLHKLWNDKKLGAFYSSMLMDSSYNVMSAAMDALGDIDVSLALEKAKQLEANTDPEAVDLITDLYAQHGTEANANYMKQAYLNCSGDELYSMTDDYASFLKRQSDSAMILGGSSLIENTAKNAESWYVRFAGMQALSQLVIASEEQGRAAAKSKDQQSEMRWNSTATGIRKKMIEVRDAEKDETLLRIYNGQNQK